MGPTWDPPGSCRPQMGPMLAPWTMLLGLWFSLKIVLFEDDDSDDHEDDGWFTQKADMSLEVSYLIAMWFGQRVWLRIWKAFSHNVTRIIHCYSVTIWKQIQYFSHIIQSWTNLSYISNLQLVRSKLDVGLGQVRYIMMTSSNGNIFRVTSPLWGESTDHRWMPLQKASDEELWCFLWSPLEQTVEQKAGHRWDAIALVRRHSNIMNKLILRGTRLITLGLRQKLVCGVWRHRIGLCPGTATIMIISKHSG